MSSNSQINPSVGYNYDTDPRTLVRLCHSFVYEGDKRLTDEECDKIIAELARIAQEEKEAWNNKPILPPTGSDEYEIIKKEVPYGGTNGNPVTEGVQNIVTLKVYNEYADYANVNFYNKDELNKFISELQEVADLLN